ncbi:MAG: aspartate aminotransferase family protein [Lentisphaeria bacterium]|nr:aspartate aminotransferase family protein [Lentisphaeria bacterium]
MKYTCIKTAIPGPKSAALLEEWHKHEAFSCGYQASVVWEKGEDCIVTDVDGNKFIDWTSGVLVTNVGHCHPKLVKAVQESVAKLINNYECPTEYRVRAAADLMSIAPKHMGKCFFFSTGAEATETAMRMMKRRTGKFEILCFESGFHGKTSGASSAGGLAGPKKGFGPTVPGVIRAIYPNPYRDELGFCDGDPEFKKYFRYLDAVIDANSTGSLAGVIVEPYQGAGGFIFPPKGWLKALEKWAHNRGMLMTVDEVQAGYGRTGKMFALEHDDLQPDIITLGKAIGCGVPVSAVVATDDVFSAFGRGEMSSTLGGNPVSSAAVSAIIEIYKEEGLVEKSAEMGAYMKAKLTEMIERCPKIGDVRGLGLINAVEIVTDKESKTPASADVIHALIDGCAEKGLLIGSVGRFGNVIRVAPPLTITKEMIDESCAIFEEVAKSL